MASITDPDPAAVQATHEDISAKGQEIPLIAEMVAALTTSAAQHERSKKSKMTEGTMSAVGAVGAGALTLASAVASTAALATPIGWGIVGAVAIGALIYGIGKHVYKKIRISNVKRMDYERTLLDIYINNGTILKQGPVAGFKGDGTPIPGTPAPSPGGPDERKLHKWYRKNFPTVEQKGWFNKLMSKKKSGKRTIQQRLEEIDAYMTKQAVTEEKSDVVYYGIVEALTTAKGDEEVTLDIDGVEQTITLKDAITQLLASKSISASDVVADVGSSNEDVLKAKITEAMKLNEMI
ncbi:hypothetical protein [Spirulina sp. 06S082]|uniref:hypothetical protein n=1 Tax=Spirulina sp. 06S082 TaxID=3110248 RepID=UPI002B20FF16|nr:hypothetical protein [Spirulina sp. 06S082]MEA5472413.1 hypothetical protein [Spirulina sp. 06S082]